VVEYRGLWSRDLIGSGLSDQVKNHTRAHFASRPRSKFLFVRRPDRRLRDGGYRVFWGSTLPNENRFWTARLASYEDVLEIDFMQPGEPLDHPLLLVCTHGKHDRCCARQGRPLYQALAELLPPHWVWQSSHIGGDRFAGNLVVLPQGLYYGRVAPTEAQGLLDDLHDGRVTSDRYRGRSCYGFAVQAAERAVREATGELGIDGVRFVDNSADGDRSLVRLRARGREFEVEVTSREDTPRFLTCNAPRAIAPRRYDARILRESAA
jgi:hypothetical protein